MIDMNTSLNLAKAFDRATGGPGRNLKKQNKYNKKALEALEGLVPPEFRFDDVNIGDLIDSDPSTALSGTAFDDIDPELRQRQIDILNRLASENFNAEQEARLNEILSRSSQLSRGQNEAIASNFQNRGIDNSGLNLAAQMLGQQQVAQNQSQQSMNIAALAQQQALANLSAQSDLAGRINSQDENKARARDAIDRFNAANSRANLERANQNTLHRYNADANNLNNYNSLLQQQYGNQADLAKTRASLYTNRANQAGANRAADLNALGQVAQGGLRMLTPTPTPASSGGKTGG